MLMIAKTLPSVASLCGSLALALFLFGGDGRAAHSGPPPQRSALEASPTEPAATEPAAKIVRDRKGEFPLEVTLAERKLVLNGSGLCEWGFLGIDLYHGALYVEKKLETAAKALKADQVLGIHLDFVCGLSTSQLREAYEASCKVNAGEDLPRYRQPLKEFTDALTAVKAGDSYTFVLIPGQGMRVLRNGKEAASIASEEFRVLFVKLYLGDNPPTAELRQGMLGAAK